MDNSSKAAAIELNASVQPHGTELDPTTTVGAGWRRLQRRVITMCELKWKSEKPTEAGVYVWRGAVSIVALVRVHRRPTEHESGGQLNGSIVGNTGSNFYDGCAIVKWTGEWIGPLPDMWL